MLRNYIKVAIRSLLKNKFFSAINIFGLATALTCCFLLANYVYHELTYDRFHEHASRIFRVTMEFGPAGSLNHVPVTGTRVLPEFLRTFPEVEQGTGLTLLIALATVSYQAATAALTNPVESLRNE